MSAPQGFSWINKPLLAALSRPSDLDDLRWLRSEGIEILISLTEYPPRRDWINDAGLLLIHEPVTDFDAPTQDQLERCVSAIKRANENQMGVAIHCAAGLGRTGTILAGYFVSEGLNAQNAIARVRRLRPGSIETEEQERSIEEFARRRSKVSGERGV